MPEAKEEHEEPDEVSEDSEPALPDRRRKLLVKSIGAVAIITLLTSTAILGWLSKLQRDNATAATEGLAAAQRFIGILTNVDAAELDENFKAAADGSTGEFKDKYAQSSTQLRQLLVENKAAAHGMVVESAVKSASPDRVEVLLFVDQSVSNAAVPEPKLDRSRIRVTMDKVEGRWLASKLELP